MATYFYEHKESPDESVLEMIEKDDIEYGESFIGMIIQEDSIQRKMKELINDNRYSFDLSLKDKFEAMDREAMYLREKINKRFEEIPYIKSSKYED